MTFDKKSLEKQKYTVGLLCKKQKTHLIFVFLSLINPSRTYDHTLDLEVTKKVNYTRYTKVRTCMVGGLLDAITSSYLQKYFQR